MEGKSVPNVTFKTRTRASLLSGNPFEWKDVTTNDLFKDKKCVLFALPGAFTPRCSTSHLPGYNASYSKFRDLGVDEIYCLSVNDAFVMRQWGISLGLEEDHEFDSLGFKDVKLIPDGTAEFTTSMGMLCNWTTERGFGPRSWRYSMYVEDGIIKKMFVEQPFVQNSAADPFEVSDAETMLKWLQK